MHPTHYPSITLKADSILEERKATRAYVQIDSIQSTIQNGDIVLRTGNDFTSESLRSLNQRDQTYSHCGIASKENDSIFVYHALGGEWNPDQKIRRDPIEIFGDPYSNRGIGVYRFKLSEKDIENFLTTVKQLHKIGVMFDMKFDLNTHDQMYCAEFVYKSLLLGTKGRIQFTFSKIGNFTFTGIDDIFLHPLCHQQIKILYK